MGEKTETNETKVSPETEAAAETPTEATDVAAEPAEATPVTEATEPEAVAAEVVEPEVVEPEIVEPEPEVIEPEVVAEPTEADRLRAELERVKAASDTSAAKLRAVSKAYTDLQKDFAAFRERQAAQSKVKLEQRSFELARTFLDPVQNLQRSIAHPGEDIAALVQGLEMVHGQFWQALERMGLEPVPGEGAVFDPKIHDALTNQPVFDQEQDGKVLHVIKAGFMANGKVLQAAQVVVGKFTEQAEA